MKYTEKGNKVIIEFEKGSDEFEYGFKPMIEQIHMLNAETVNLACGILQEMQKPDPKKDVIGALSGIFSQLPDSAWEQVPNHEEYLERIYEQVGEPIGPFCYACWQLTSLTSSALLRSTVDEVIEYYETYWNFEKED